MLNKLLKITSRRSVSAIYGERLKKDSKRAANRVARRLYQPTTVTHPSRSGARAL